MKAALSFVELAVSDWAGARRWFREVLRLEEALVDEAGHFALFGAGGARLALKEGAPPAEGVVLSFEVDDLAAWRAHLGVLAGEVKESGEGYRRVRLQGPGRCSVVLFEWAR